MEFATGDSNTAIGTQTLQNNATGNNNIAIGDSAGENLTTGDNNIDIGSSGVDGESNTIRIGGGTSNHYGSQTATFIAGIHGVDKSSGSPVFIDTNGQLGTGTLEPGPQGPPGHKDPQVQLVLLAHKAPQVTLEQQAPKVQLVQPEQQVHKELLAQPDHKALLV